MRTEMVRYTREKGRSDRQGSTVQRWGRESLRGERLKKQSKIRRFSRDITNVKMWWNWWEDAASEYLFFMLSGVGDCSRIVAYRAMSCDNDKIEWKNGIRYKSCILHNGLKLACMYLFAAWRIERFEDFFSSCDGSCLFRSSKHSFRCALRFFSSLLCTSLVPDRITHVL